MSLGDRAPLAREKESAPSSLPASAARRRPREDRERVRARAVGGPRRVPVARPEDPRLPTAARRLPAIARRTIPRSAAQALGGPCAARLPSARAPLERAQGTPHHARAG